MSGVIFEMPLFYFNSKKGKDMENIDKKQSQEILKAENISIIRDGHYIIKDISFSVNQGENWAIIGRNGSGKSFMLKILSTLVYPSEGEITIYGKKFGETNIWDLRKKIGVVSDRLQQTYNGNTCVQDVILSGFFSSIGLHQDIEDWQIERVKEIMDFLRLTPMANRPFESLSQGEQKRALIGRALVFKPQLIILDEPCSGLDIASRDDFLKFLREMIAEGMQIIFVTHHIEEIIPEISHVMLMEKGRIYKSGKKEDMMKRKQLRYILGVEKFKMKKKKGRYWPRYY